MTLSRPQVAPFRLECLIKKHFPTGFGQIQRGPKSILMDPHPLYFYKMTDLKKMIEISFPDDGVSVFCCMYDCACNTVFSFFIFIFYFYLGMG